MSVLEGGEYEMAMFLIGKLANVVVVVNVYMVFFVKMVETFAVVAECDEEK